MAGHAGFDSYAFPGLAQMRWLLGATNLRWCGYYLAPAPSHPDTAWMGRRAALAALGWGLAPIFVGQQIVGPGQHSVTGGQGVADGRRAAQLLRLDGFEEGSTVFLDIEEGPPLCHARAAYTGTWADTVNAEGYRAGVYASHDLALALHNLRPELLIWAFNVASVAAHPVPGVNYPDPHPAGCGYAGAYMWQLAQNCRISLPGAPIPAMMVDLSTAVCADPSAAVSVPANPQSRAVAVRAA
jgi:hypothetical protein